MIEVDEESIRMQARKDGSLNLREAGLEKVKMGLTSIEEVIGKHQRIVKFFTEV